MKTDEETLQNYISRLPAQVGEHNASLMKTFMAKYQALPSEPSTKRLILVVLRLKSISIMMNNAPLDELTEQDIMNLNTTMRKKGMLSAQDYRKTLRRFLRLTDKKKYYDLLESDYLKAAPKKANERLLVDADTITRLNELKPLHNNNTETVIAAILLYRKLNESELKRIYNKDKPDIQ